MLSLKHKTCTQIYDCSTEFAKFIVWEWTGVSDHRLDLEKLLGKSDWRQFDSLINPAYLFYQGGRLNQREWATLIQAIYVSDELAREIIIQNVLQTGKP